MYALSPWRLIPLYLQQLCGLAALSGDFGEGSVMMTMLVLLFFSSISYISAFRNVKSVDFWRLSMPVIQPSCPRRLSLIDCDISTSHPASCPPHGSMRFRRSSMRLYAAKKKKRKKVLKADGAATSSSGNDASQSAARVSNQMNVSG